MSEVPAGCSNCRERVLVLAPTARAASETFIRANLNGLSLDLTAYFGDDFPLHAPWRLAYGSAIVLSKLFTRLHWLRRVGSCGFGSLFCRVVRRTVASTTVLQSSGMTLTRAATSICSS